MGKTDVPLLAIVIPRRDTPSVGVRGQDRQKGREVREEIRSSLQIVCFGGREGGGGVITSQEMQEGLLTLHYDGVCILHLIKDLGESPLVMS